MQESMPLDSTIPEYRLGRKGNFWIAFTSHGTGNANDTQLQVTARNRGGSKTLAVLLESTPVRPLATVTVRGETYPLTISWHLMRRGGILSFGGQRRTGVDGSTVEWEMRWVPLHGEPGSFDVQMRVRASPRREGHLSIFLNAPLPNPELWRMPPAAARDHSAVLAWSAYNQCGLGFVTTDSEPGAWNEERNSFSTSWQAISLGGGRLLRLSLRFLNNTTALSARSALVRQYITFAGAGLHLVPALRPLTFQPALHALTHPENSYSVGAERIYLKPPSGEKDTYYAGFPFYPADALCALSNHHQFQPGDTLSRLIRFGSHALAADFQVMGRQGESEPNKGAFWDRSSASEFTDYAGGATHGIASNSRLARAFFLLYESTKEPLLRQSALNVCQWLILKQNDRGYFDGARVYATRTLPDDGRFLPQPCSLDGAEALRPLVLAFRATGNEVFLKAAWKIANFLMEERLPTFDSVVPTDAASVILGLCALDAEAPNARLRTALENWGAWLRALPLDSAQQSANYDQLSAGRYECAQAGFSLHALTGDPSYLRYGYAALAAVPEDHQARAWHAIIARTMALLSTACLLPGWHANFDMLQMTAGWRVFAPDPATAQYLKVTAAEGQPVDYLPLVCRLNDQVLITVIAPPHVSAVNILKNSKRPLVHDLLTGSSDVETLLHPAAGETWASVGIFLISP